MNIILFGPPGVGKSTLVGWLKVHNMHAIDLEDVYPSRIRFQIPNEVDNCILGAADLSPRRSYPKCKKVLLHLPQSEYEARRAHRDALEPSKANQTEQKVDDWLKGVKYDQVLDVSKPLDSVGRELLKYANSVFKTSRKR